jgi:hypothetical protein
MKQLTKVIVFQVFSVKKWFGTDFQVFSLPKIVRNGIPSFFSSENGSERNSEVSSSENGLERNSKISSSENGSERNSKVFIVENGLEWNGFSLPRNSSERNSKVFLFRETDGISTGLPSVPSCFVFRGIIFVSENGDPRHM